MLEKNPTQYDQVKDHLFKHGSITTFDAIQEYLITRLSEYIRLLRNDGYGIKTTWKNKRTPEGKFIKRWALYTLVRGTD